MTGLLPVFASLSVYCLWMEIKHGSVARVGKPDKMLTSTAAGVLPKTPTQGSHQCRPVATCYNYLQLYSTPFFFPFCHFSVHTWDKVSVSVCPFAGAFRSFIIFYICLFLRSHTPTFPPSAAPHHLFFLPFSAHLCFFPYSHPFLSPQR